MAGMWSVSEPRPGEVQQQFPSSGGARGSRSEDGWIWTTAGLSILAEIATRYINDIARWVTCGIIVSTGGGCEARHRIEAYFLGTLVSVTIVLYTSIPAARSERDIPKAYIRVLTPLVTSLIALAKIAETGSNTGLPQWKFLAVALPYWLLYVVLFVAPMIMLRDVTATFSFLWRLGGTLIIAFGVAILAQIVAEILWVVFHSSRLGAGKFVVAPVGVVIAGGVWLVLLFRGPASSRHRCRLSSRRRRAWIATWSLVFVLAAGLWGGIVHGPPSTVTESGAGALTYIGLLSPPLVAMALATLVVPGTRPDLQHLIAGVLVAILAAAIAVLLIKLQLRVKNLPGESEIIGFALAQAVASLGAVLVSYLSARMHARSAVKEEDP